MAVSEKGSKLNTRYILRTIAIIVAMVLLDAASLFVIGKINDKAPDYGVYASGGNFYLENYTEGESTLLGEDFSGKLEFTKGSHIGMYLETFVKSSEDGRIICYPSDVTTGNGSDKSFEISVLDTETGEKTKVASDVSSYSLSFDGSNINFLTLNDKTLYRYDIDKKRKTVVLRDIVDYKVRSDGNRCVARDSSNSLFLCTAGMESEKISENTDEITFVSDDYSNIFYREGSSLFIKTAESDSKLISNDADEVICCYNSKEAYFLKDTGYDSSLSAFVDTADADGNELLSKVMESTIHVSGYILYYYDGNSTHELSRTYCNPADKTDYYHSTGKPVICFKAMKTDVPKVKLNECYVFDELKNKVTANIYRNNEQFIACGNIATDLGVTKEEKFDINKSGSAIFYVSDIGNDGITGTLYKRTINGEVIGNAEKYDENVSDAYNAFLTNTRYLYYKNFSQTKGDIFINGSLAGQNTEADTGFDYFSAYDHENDVLVYISDWSEDVDKGNLRVCRDGKIKDIDENVSTFCLTENGNVAYVKNGKLMYFDGRKSRSMNRSSDSLTSLLDRKTKKDSL